MTQKKTRFVEKIVKNKDVKTPSIRMFFKKLEQTGKQAGAELNQAQES